MFDEHTFSHVVYLSITVTSSDLIMPNLIGTSTSLQWDWMCGLTDWLLDKQDCSIPGYDWLFCPKYDLVHVEQCMYIIFYIIHKGSSFIMAYS